MKKTNGVLCLATDCDKPAFKRGLCRSCLNAFYYQVRVGKTTEAKSIKRGAILPAKPRGRKPGTAFSKMLAAK